MKYSTENVSNKYKMLSVSVPKQFVYSVQLNRPEKLNALNSDMWKYVFILYFNQYYTQNLILIILQFIENLKHALMTWQ